MSKDHFWYAELKPSRKKIITQHNFMSAKLTLHSFLILKSHYLYISVLGTGLLVALFRWKSVAPYGQFTERARLYINYTSFEYFCNYYSLSPSATWWLTAELSAALPSPRRLFGLAKLQVVLAPGWNVHISHFKTIFTPEKNQFVTWPALVWVT